MNNSPESDLSSSTLSRELPRADRSFIRFAAVLLQVPDEVVLANVLARRSKLAANLGN